jgi:hypothetical protein
MFLLKAGLFSVFSLLVLHVKTSRPAKESLLENRQENEKEKPIVLAAKTCLENFTHFKAIKSE